MCLSVRVAVYNIMFFIAKIVAQQGHGKLCKAQPRERGAFVAMND